MNEPTQRKYPNTYNKKNEKKKQGYRPLRNGDVTPSGTKAQQKEAVMRPNICN